MKENYDKNAHLNADFEQILNFITNIAGFINDLEENLKDKSCRKKSLVFKNIIINKIFQFLRELYDDIHRVHKKASKGVKG